MVYLNSQLELQTPRRHSNYSPGQGQRISEANVMKRSEEIALISLLIWAQAMTAIR